MIYLLCATIKPDIFIKTHHDWITKANNKDNIRTKVIVDSQYDLEKLKDFDCALYSGYNVGITKPLYQLTSSLRNLNDNDIIVVMSDDFFPPKDWDSILIEQFKNHDGALLVNDGYSNQNNILSIPIMTWSCLKRLDTIVYHPVYNHMFSDNELFDILKEKNLIKKTDANIIFEHRHWITKKRIKDDNDDKLASQDIFEADRELYLKRKSLRLSEKLKVDLKKQYLLSVLICTIPSRKNALNCLLKILNNQNLEDVEILIEEDDPINKRTVGEKRNRLLNRSSGKYICFIDDDDIVSMDYISSIKKACRYNPDCVGISGVLVSDTTEPKIFIHSLKFQKWDFVDGYYVRYPNHLNPVKRAIAIKVGFNNLKNKGEDREYSDAIFKILKTEYYIENITYIYNYKEKNVLSK